MRQKAGERILARVRGGGRGEVYTNKDFLDLASRDAVDRALRRLADGGELRRIHRGIYYYPQTSPSLGITLSPNPDKVASAIARRTGSRIEPSGALAANILGLSTQVPAKLIYLTEGPSKTLKIDRQSIVLRHVAPKRILPASKISRLVFQALSHMGRDAVDDTMIRKLRRVLPDSDKRRLLKDVRYQSDWIVAVVRRIVESED